MTLRFRHNNSTAIALKAIKNTRIEIFRKYIFKTNLVDNFSQNLEIMFNLPDDAALSIEFCRQFLFSNDHLLRNWKTLTNYFYARYKRLFSKITFLNALIYLKNLMQP